MLGFFRRGKLQRVRALLEGRVNQEYVRTLQEGDRHGIRGALCEVAFVVPYASGRRPEFAAGRPTITRDMSWSGFSIVDDTLVDAETILVALRHGDGFRFLHCRVEHCTHLGYGHFQVGLQPTELVEFDGAELEAFRARVAAVEAEVASKTPGTVEV